MIENYQVYICYIGTVFFSGPQRPPSSFAYILSLRLVNKIQYKQQYEKKITK